MAVCTEILSVGDWNNELLLGENMIGELTYV